MSDGEYRLFWCLMGVFGGGVACMWVIEQGDQSGWSPIVTLN